MCCLFGFVDYGHQLSRKQRSRLLSVLSTACEERGTDATGIAYNAAGKQVIFKRPLPAHLMWYRVPADATIVMGHTRMTTQGSEKRNENNHPFSGNIGKAQFALAHNGVLYNDKSLRRELKLPDTKIETDSYVAVQLLEKYGKLDFDGLRFMSEELEGSFTISALSDRDELFIAKGNNPIVIHHFPDSKLYATFMPPWTRWSGYEPVKRPYAEDTSYLDDLKAVAVYFARYWTKGRMRWN